MYRCRKQMYGTYLSNYTRDKLRKHIDPNAKLTKFLCNFKRVLTVRIIFFFSVSQSKNKRKCFVFRLFHAHRETDRRMDGRCSLTRIPRGCDRSWELSYLYSVKRLLISSHLRLLFILQLTLLTYGVKVRTSFNCLWIGTGGSLFWTFRWLYNRRETSVPAKRLPGSQEGLCYIETTGSTTLVVEWFI